MSLKVLIAVLAAVCGMATAFDFTEVRPKEVTVKEGEQLELWCVVDDWWEWCTFKHNDNVCDFMWDQSLYNVTTLDCKAYEGRYRYENKQTYKQTNAWILDGSLSGTLCLRSTLTFTGNQKLPFN